VGLSAFTKSLGELLRPLLDRTADVVPIIGKALRHPEVIAFNAKGRDTISLIETYITKAVGEEPVKPDD
jgi:hypothetical protein